MIIGVPRDARNRLEAILTNCVRRGPAAENREGRPEWRSHLEGTVAWVRQVSPRHAERLEPLLAGIDWTR